jgi:hypothetical protein
MSPWGTPGARRRIPNPLDLAWFRLGPDWSWLVVAPAADGQDVVPVARALAGVGADVSGGAVEFRDETRLARGGVADLVTGLRREGRGSRVVVALASPLASPAALEVARSADGVVLCVPRGKVPVAGVRAIAEAVGRERIVCALLLD